MKHRQWSARIPGTELQRLDVLMLMKVIRQDPTMQVKELRNDNIRHLATLGVFNAPQIATVIGCSPPTVWGVVSRMDPSLVSMTNSRSKLHPEALDLLLVCAQNYASGKQPVIAVIRNLTEHCGQGLAERLAGIPTVLFNSARRVPAKAKVVPVEVLP